MVDEHLSVRLVRLEARWEIQQLAVRYAQAVDARDVEAWLDCFRPDRDRERLRGRIEPLLRTFRRSVHHITGHRVDLTGAGHGTGVVYCRAEHEVDDRWIVMSLCYFDDYVAVDDRWYFARRRERHWYSADVTERPQDAGFAAWPVPGPSSLPECLPTWHSFWGTEPANGEAGRWAAPET